MAYDDDSSHFGWGDFVDLEQFIATLLTQPENLSLTRLTAALQGLSQLTATQHVKSVTVYDAHRVLEQQGLGNFPMSTVVSILDAVEPYTGSVDLMSKLTLRDLEGILTKARK
jgi:hypothetical protein